MQSGSETKVRYIHSVQDVDYSKKKSGGGGGEGALPKPSPLQNQPILCAWKS